MFLYLISFSYLIPVRDLLTHFRYSREDVREDFISPRVIHGSLIYSNCFKVVKVFSDSIVKLST